MCFVLSVKNSRSGESLFLLTFGGFVDGMPRMKRNTLLPLMLCSLYLSACTGGMMMWPVEDNKPDYTRGSKDSPAVDGRAPLDVPPELRDQVSVPMPDQVAVDSARNEVKLTPVEKQAIAGKAVTLDTREYDKPASEVFSAVVDALTALNKPVESVDSPSGTITTAWVRQDSGSAGNYMNAALNVFGGGTVPTRYRFIVRVFRMQDGKSQLQIRTLGQQYINHHWMFKELKRKVANELFSATEERLGMMPAEPSSAPTDGGASTPPVSDEAPAAKP